MERNQAKELFKKIKIAYPRFDPENDIDTAIFWLDRLEKGDYEKSRAQLEYFIETSKWQPTIADVLVRKKPSDSEIMKNQIREAEERVRREKEDPEMAERRKQRLKEMREEAESKGIFYE